jgi:putative DNA primase/helicase
VTSPPAQDPKQLIADIVEGVGDGAAPREPPDDGGALEPSQDACDALGPSDSGDGALDNKIVARCAALDHSDTDNGKRLIEHFGGDLVVMAQGGVSGGDWLAWDGRHWDLDNGSAQATIHAQKIGGRIAAEVEFLDLTRQESAAIRAAERFSADDKSDDAQNARAAAKAAVKGLRARKLARWRFAVTSKNKARICNALDMAAPHLRRPVDAFNADPLVIVTNTHTLRLRVAEARDSASSRRFARIDAAPEFKRADYATGLVPCDYDPHAQAPKFEAFLAQMLTDAASRRTVRQYAGTGLLGLLLQRLMFHHGFGANGKSVFLAVISAVVGKSYGVSLPKETVLGQGERGAGQASPDIVRLFGKRFVRIDELKEGEAVREDLVKRLTGGDEMAVRNLFRGYFDFANRATPHMSGNGFPRIDGTDNGIWRRMLIVHWDVTIPEEARKDFDAFVAELLQERSGILNWLLAGALDFLENGLVVAPKIAEATHDYQVDMNPIGEFIDACIEVASGAQIGANAAYQAYVSWSKANAKRERTQTMFGREMAKRFKRDDKRTRSYLDCRLHDVPNRPDAEGLGE